jgi:urease gamma subunit
VIPNSKAVGSIAPLMSQVMSTGRGGGNVLAVVNVGGSVITERDLVEIVRRVLFDVARRNGGSTGIS